MIRVLHLGKFYPPFAGGMENFLGDLLPALREQSIDSRALVHNDPAHPLAATSVVSGVTVHRAACYGTLLYAPVAPGFPLLLQKIIREFQPQLLHLHLPNLSAFWCLFSPQARRIPWIVHWHSDVVASTIDRRLGPAYCFYRLFEQRLLARATQVITTSQRYMDSSEPLAQWRDKCSVVPLGLETRRMEHPQLERGWAEGMWDHSSHPFRIVAIGRLTYYKGHEILIQAAARLDNVQVCIVGTGEKHAELARLIDSLGVADRVRLCGGLPEAKVHGLLASCHCLCLPSIERTEAFGLVLLEAMYFARPIIASDVAGSGMGWVVKNENTGTLVVPNDVSRLAEAIDTLAHDDQLQQRYGSNGKKRFLTHFQIDNITEQLKNLYEQYVEL